MNAQNLIEILHQFASKTPNELPWYLDKKSIHDGEIKNIPREDLLEIIYDISLCGARIWRGDVVKILEAANMSTELSSSEDSFLKAAHDAHKKDRRPNVSLQPIISEQDNSIVKEFRKDINNLSQKITELDKKQGDTFIDEKISDIKNLVAQISHSGQELTAPIKLPAPEDIEVKLVSADSLDRLDEYQNDLNVYLTLCGVFLGGFLGLLGNIFIASQPVINKEVWGILMILIFISLVFGLLIKKTLTRKEKVREIILKKDNSISLDDYSTKAANQSKDSCLE